MKVKLSQLNVHPDNERIYQPTDLDDLIDSISANGLLEPLVITKKKTIISGHRRHACLIKLDVKEIECRIVEPKNEIIALIEHNRHRQKTASDIINESRYLEREMKQYVGRGRNATQNRQGKKVNSVEEISKKLGIGTTQLKKLKSIGNYEPTLLDDIDKGKLSIDAAYQKVRRKHMNKGRAVDDVEQFQKSFKSLLRKYEPDLDDVNSTLSQIYPYSLLSTGVAEERRALLVDQLEFLKSLQSDELVLAYKQDELNHSQFSKKQLKWAKSFLPTLDDLEKFIESEPTKDDVELILVGDGEIDRTLWNIFRLTIHNMEHEDGVGRRMSAVVGFRKKKKFKLLGLISFQSDSAILTARDDYIGWNEIQRSKNREKIVNLHVCVPSQPFGANFLGGKFLSMMCLDLVQHWNKHYKTEIVGITTTALHGRYSQYSSMRWWKQLGKSEGRILIKPFRDEYTFWKDWFVENYSDIHQRSLATESSTPKTGPKQIILSNIYRLLDIPLRQFEHGQKRGVYFCSLYENSREYLCDKLNTPIDKLLPEKDQNKLVASGWGKAGFQPIQDDWWDWWINKATTRYDKLVAEDRYEEDQLWYEPVAEQIDKIDRWLGSKGRKKMNFSDFKV